ncbi:MAG: hypothetical protein ABIH53_04925, partial [archaeon]
SAICLKNSLTESASPYISPKRLGMIIIGSTGLFNGCLERFDINKKLLKNIYLNTHFRNYRLYVTKS